VTALRSGDVPSSRLGLRFVPASRSPQPGPFLLQQAGRCDPQRESVSRTERTKATNAHTDKEKAN